jgi:AcrR family transcriptional regulator
MARLQTGWMPAEAIVPYSSVSRRLIAAQGVRGFSMRALAKETGTSLGSLGYRLGDKSAIFARLIQDERSDRAAVHDVWLHRGGLFDLSQPPVLAAFVLAWLDEAAGQGRDAALTRSELLLEAGIPGTALDGFGALLDDEQRFWIALLTPDHGPRAADLGRAICDYCRDELPFSVALGEDSNYRLLRAATVERLAAGLAGDATGLARHFDALVELCGSTSAEIPLPVDLPEGSRKAELATHVAGIIAEQGAANVTHRLVAARAGVPNSSVAHHYRTRDDLLTAGMGALILEMRQGLQVGMRDANRPGLSVLRSTHSIALAAARDPTLRPFALDMRRRRGENVRVTVATALCGSAALDHAAIQAAVIAMVGSALASQVAGATHGTDAFAMTGLARLRASFADVGSGSALFAVP